MLRFTLTLLTVFTISAASSAKADIVTDMRAIAQFCLHYVETGQITNVLLKNGFSQQGRKFKKNYNASAIGGTKPVITVDPRKSRVGFSCSSQFGIISRSDWSPLTDSARQSAYQLGYASRTVVSSRGEQVQAFVGLSGIPIRFGGSLTSSHSSYSALIYFERF
jgi:hypothetical protein